MNISADACYKIGSSHVDCEDYAIGDFVSDVGAHICVSDGCSSGEDTVIGSRLTCMLARNLFLEGKHGDLEFFYQLDKLEQKVTSLFSEFQEPHSLALKQNSLFATLLDCRFDEKKNQFFVKLVGDGLIAARHRDSGFIEWVKADFEDGAPVYPVYCCHYDLQKKYMAEFSTKQTITRGVIGSDETSTGAFGGFFSREFEFDADKFDLVCLFSDGIFSFRRPMQTATSKMFEPVPFEEVLTEVMSFKGFSQGFVRRRCQKFFKNTCTSLGWDHYDDFSMAAIHVG